MKKLLMASAATLALTGAASAEDVKLGVLIGFTGPIESLTSHMANAAEAAMAEVNASGKSAHNFLSVRGDSTTGRNRSIVASRGASRPRKKDAKQQLPTRSTLSPPNAR